jgi:hypothetical protein
MSHLAKESRYLLFMQQSEQVARKEKIPDIDVSGLDMQHLVP